MDWTCTATVTLPALAAGAAWLAIGALLLGLGRAAASRERHALAEPAPPKAVPRTPHELVASALVRLEVEHATLFSADTGDQLRILARGHLDVRADIECPEVHIEAAAATVDAERCVEFGGAAPAPLVAAMPVVLRGRTVGALAVSSWSAQRGRLTFAHRRALRELAETAAALPELEPRVRELSR